MSNISRLDLIESKVAYRQALQDNIHKIDDDIRESIKRDDLPINYVYERRLVQTAYFKELTKISVWLETQNVDLLKFVGDEAHDYLCEYFKGINSETQIVELPKSYPLNTVYPLPRYWWYKHDEAMSATLDTRSVKLEKFGRRIRGVFFTDYVYYYIGYAPEINTLYIRRGQR